MNVSATTVLIAEDDPVFRRVLTFTIARTGLAVEAVCDGAAAFDRLKKGGIDFLITDHQMPICSGLELLQRIVDDKSIGKIPTVLCTAKGLELDTQGLKKKFDLVEVMHKPFSPRRLSDLITSAVEAIRQDVKESSHIPLGIASVHGNSGVHTNA
ncbi:Chemotaxis protein CheY [Rubripirellula lacrimiformis]|uniref:Chemotaxis protein CheY n=1 Tax=Rubripirellula lacrimiformis TaxID=1930273 RepID=A0A517NHT3_9BACT|nr:response regulator [Rubripirellula lacrimiformis]QDT06694.1 Chemotaxis protein CheY [Rubripirellula lacrimiformis]